MNFGEKMRKYETVNGHHCEGCGNPWYFLHDNSVGECTTCGKHSLLKCSVCGAKTYDTAKVFDDKVVCGMCIEERRYIKVRD